ncbi:histone-like nucleoid-structuring protein Lsr2 [Geodermatophilus sp. SYSU D01105]
MAQRKITRFLDDLDGTEIVDGAGRTVRFALDGREYEIDLTNEHADEMAAVLDRYVSAARRVTRRSARTKSTGAKSTAPADYNAQDVRTWAKANNIDVPSRGRIPRSVVDQFHAAGN